MKGLSDIPGIKVGHASDFEGITGCTAILCEAGATAGVEIVGSATGSEELDVLSPLHLTPKIHGICLAGGSAFGLEAVSGVRRHLERQGVGFQTRAAKVPLVAGAILYDLDIGKPNARPTREMGEFAAAEASTAAVPEGCVGAGTGARVGLANGLSCAMKGGLGTFTVQLPGGVLVSALSAVNPLGDVLDGNGSILAGARKSKTSKEFLDSAAFFKQQKPEISGGHTVLTVVATNAALSKVECSRLARLASHGLVRSISPVGTIHDGDIVFALSTGTARADSLPLGIAAAEAVAESVRRAVRAARPLGGLPALSE